MRIRNIGVGLMLAAVTVVAATACASTDGHPPADAAATADTAAPTVSQPSTTTPTRPASSSRTSTSPAAATGHPLALADLFHYVDIATAATDPQRDEPMTWVPKAAAQDTAVILGHLDPAHGHVRALKSNAGNGDHIVPDTDPQAAATVRVALAATWTVDGTAPQVRTDTLSGLVEVYFGSAPAPPSATRPCGHDVYDLVLDSGPGVTWSPCASSTLADGSTVGTASAGIGAGTLTVAFRDFPGGGAVAVYATDYPIVGTHLPAGPSAKVVLSPSPFSGAALAEALSDPSLTPGLTARRTAAG